MTIRVTHPVDTLTASTNILTVSASGALTLPSGNTAARPTPVNGMIRYNSELNLFEGYQNSAWTNLVLPTDTIPTLSPAWGFSADNSVNSAPYRDIQSFTGAPLNPLISLSASLDISAALALDFIGASGATVMPGIYVQHIQSGGSASTNAFSHSIMGYAVNSSLGDNDVIGVSGRVRKTNVVGGIGDAAGMWGSAYQSSSQNGGVMGLEGHIYQNVSGTAAQDTLGSKWSVALHLRSDSTGSAATAGMAMTGAAGGGSGFGVWNGIILEKGLWGGAGTAGTVGINCADWNASYYPEYGIKFGEATQHLYRASGNINLSATALAITGNLTFVGTARRITGDFSNGTASNRTLIQTSTTNANTSVNIITNGSGTVGSMGVCNGSDIDNAASVQIISGTTGINGINSFKRGTGTTRQIDFAIDGASKLAVGTAGDVLIGGTAAGTSGQVFTSGGAGAPPTWTSPSASLTSTQVGFGSGTNTLTGDADFTYTATTGAFYVNTTNGFTSSANVASPGTVAIVAPGHSGTGSAGSVWISGGTPNNGDGGGVDIRGTDGVGTTQTGGSITIQAGGSVGNTSSGSVNISGGYATTLNGTGGGASLIGGAAHGSATGANSLVQGGSGGATGNGGIAQLLGGNGGSTSGNGGIAQVVGGSPITSGNGGQAKLMGGNAFGTNKNGGIVTVAGGNATGSGTAGPVTIAGGVGGVTSTGGTVTITGGAGGTTSGNGGDVSVVGGTPVDGNGGSISITGIAGVGTNKNGGSITITAGAKTGSGADGVINLVIPATGALQINGAAGTSGQVLTSNGATTAPTWQSVSASEAGAITFTMTNGNAGTINKGDVVYVSAAGTVDRGDADATATSTPVIGVVFDATIATTASGKICSHGKVTGLSGLTAGSTYYLSQTPGQPTATAPTASGTWVVPIGIALSTTELLVNVGTPIQN